jgi:hypothetical protein
MIFETIVGFIAVAFILGAILVSACIFIGSALLVLFGAVKFGENEEAPKRYVGITERSYDYDED